MHECDICHGEVDQSNGVLHSVETNSACTVSDKFFAIYKWEERFAHVLGKVHKGICLEAQIRKYMVRFKWGIASHPAGAAKVIARR